MKQLLAKYNSKIKELRREANQASVDAVLYRNQISVLEWERDQARKALGEAQGEIWILDGLPDEVIL